MFTADIIPQSDVLLKKTDREVMADVLHPIVDCKRRRHCSILSLKSAYIELELNTLAPSHLTNWSAKSWLFSHSQSAL